MSFPSRKASPIKPKNDISSPAVFTLPEEDSSNGSNPASEEHAEKIRETPSKGARAHDKKLHRFSFGISPRRLTAPEGDLPYPRDDADEIVIGRRRFSSFYDIQQGTPDPRKRSESLTSSDPPHMQKIEALDLQDSLMDKVLSSPIGRRVRTARPMKRYSNIRVANTPHHGAYDDTAVAATPSRVFFRLTEEEEAEPEVEPCRMEDQLGDSTVATRDITQELDDWESVLKFARHYEDILPCYDA